MKSVTIRSTTFDFINKRNLRHSVSVYDVMRNTKFFGVVTREQLITPQGVLRRVYTFVGEGPTVIVHEELRTILRALV